MLSNHPLSARNGRGTPRIAYDVTMPVALAVHLFVVGAVVGGMVRFSADDRLQVLLPLGVASIVFGYALALTRVPDVLSHVAAVWLGAVGAVVAVGLSVYTPVEIVDARGRVFWDLARAVGTGIGGSEASRLSDPDLLTLLALTIWMLGYTSAWVLYRRGWLAAALVPPAVVLIISLRSAADRPVWPMAMFIFAAVILWARRQILERQRGWAHRGLRTPEMVSLRAVGLALPAAVLILGVGAALPISAPRAAVEPVTGAVSETWDTVRDEVAGRLGMEGAGSGNYAEFPESFEIGGELELSEEIVATLDADEAHYLGLRRYDTYDGAGWSSRVDETFRLDGDGPSTNVTNVIFARSQPVALSRDVTEGRASVAGIVTVVRPKDDLAFTIETFSGSSEAVVTVLGWQRIDRPAIDVASLDVGALPVDLQGLISDLQQADVVPGSAGNDVRFADEAVRDRIDIERERLAKYPVETTLAYDDDGRLTVALDGRIPNYDDIEAVFVDGMIAGDQYRVIGQQSIVAADELVVAGDAYPRWVGLRYLTHSETVTERTRSLAETVVIEAGATTPFDQALAIQEYLRTSFTYDLNPPVGENGEDIVDYFLFESRVGRCEQYASAMVVMLRSLGIPSRLVSGYRSADEVNDVGQYVFREQQAHTWVEVYFPAFGWIPFEPTAGQDRFDYESNDDAPATPSPETERDPPTVTPPPAVDVTETPLAEATPPVSPALVQPERGGGSTPWGPIALAGALLLGGTALVLLRRGTNPRGLSPVAGLYAALLRMGSRRGVQTTPSTTPQEFGTALSHALPQAGPAIATIVDAYHWEQFGPPAEREARLGRAREAWRLVRQGQWRYRLPRRAP